MAMYQWDSKPGMSPKQVEARFGKGTKLVKMANGKWGLRGADGKPYGPGTLRGPGPTTDTPSTPSPENEVEWRPTTEVMDSRTDSLEARNPMPQVPVFTNAGMEARLAALGNQLLAIPGLHNARRAGVFIEGQQALADRGLTDVYRDAQGNLVRFTTQVAPLGEQTPTGSQQYQLAGGAEGQAFRDARSNIAANYGSRGAYFGSARADDQRRANENLTDARAAIQRNMASAQTGINQNEVEATAGVIGELGTAQGDYAGWRTEQNQEWTQNQIAAGSQPSAPDLAAPLLPAASTPAAPTSAAGVRPVWSSKPKYTPQQIRTRFGAGATLVKSGSGKWTIKGV